VLVVGILRNGSGAQFLYDVDEKKLLRMTWLELETKEADEIFVTFNGSRFDWPMLARRSFALGRPSGVMGRPRSPVPLSERRKLARRRYKAKLDACGLVLVRVLLPRDPAARLHEPAATHQLAGLLHPSETCKI